MIKILGKALSSNTRLNILKILSKFSRLSSIEVYRKFITEFGEKNIRRETIYKELENLLSSGIIDKEYDKGEKKLFYILKFKQIIFDLSNFEIRLD